MSHIYMRGKAFLRVVQSRKMWLIDEKKPSLRWVYERSKWLTLLVVCACMNIMAFARNHAIKPFSLLWKFGVARANKNNYYYDDYGDRSTELSFFFEQQIQ